MRPARYAASAVTLIARVGPSGAADRLPALRLERRDLSTMPATRLPATRFLPGGSR